MLLAGLVGTIAMVIILLQSPSIVRHAFYETFLHLHIALVVALLIGLYIHLKALPQMSLLIGAIVCWKIEVGGHFIR